MAIARREPVTRGSSGRARQAPRSSGGPTETSVELFQRHARLHRMHDPLRAGRSAMHRARRVAHAAIAAVILAAFAGASAFAAAPTRTIEVVHIEGTFPAGSRCPFEVTRTIDGTLTTTVFTDADGLTTTSFRYA